MALSGERRAGRARPQQPDSAAFDALLRALDADRDQAAERYEELRRRIRRFFVWRGCRTPDELVDETIDRVGRRLAGGETIRAADVGRYFLGVARNVLRESWGRERKEGLPQGIYDMTDRVAAPDPAEDGDADARLECLERCLGELGSESRTLVLRYYEGEATGRIEARRVLAEQLAVAPGALRIRVHRIRERLEECVRHCMAARETSAGGAPPTIRRRRS